MLTSHVADGRLAVNHSQCSLVSEKDEQNYTRLTVEAGLKSDSARKHVGHADLVHVPRLGRERTSRHRLAEIRHVDVVLACSHEIVGGSDVTSKERERERERERQTERQRQRQRQTERQRAWSWIIVLQASVKRITAQHQQSINCV